MYKDYSNLIERALIARQRAYCPYSQYAVGSAVLWNSHMITEGVNVENASYGLTICAERSAIVHGVSQGQRTILAVAFATQRGMSFTIPCGACMQMISEFCSADTDIIHVNGSPEYVKDYRFGEVWHASSLKNELL